MTRPVLIGTIAAVIVVGGGAAYMLTKDDEDKDKTNTSQGSSDSSNFNPASTEGLEFKATITTDKDGQQMTATLEYDDQKNSRYSSNVGGMQTEVIYTKDAYYTCQSAGNCIKFPLSQSSNSGINPADYTYDDAKIADYRGGAKYLGKKDCPAGTCDVWQTTTPAGTATIYIDSVSRRISQAESTVSGATSKIVYEYTDVTIEIPQNAQTVQVPTQ